FRVSSVLHARLDPAEAFRPTAPEALARFEGESLGGFREPRAAVACVFFVRQPEAAWVGRNLLERMTAETLPNGIRVSIETTAVSVVARFVVALGGAGEAESAELAAGVAELAEGALWR